MNKYKNAEHAIAKGVKVGELFKDNKGYVRRIESLDGLPKTRGEYGDLVYASFLMMERHSGEYVKYSPTVGEHTNSNPYPPVWCIWDGDYGWIELKAA